MLWSVHRLIENQILSLQLKFQVILSISMDTATFSVRHVNKCEHNSNARARELWDKQSFAYRRCIKRPSMKNREYKNWKLNNFLTLGDIDLIFGIQVYRINTTNCENFFENQMMQTSPTSLPAEILPNGITSAKFVRFGWNLVCKSV